MTKRMVAAILSGGLGTRLRPVLPNTAKVMAEVDGRPFLEIILDQLETSGISTVVLCIGYLSEQIRSCFGERRGELKLLYSEEKEPLGTAGALRLALPLLSSKSILVLNGDSSYSGRLSPFIDWHHKRMAPVSILLAKVEDTRRFGLVETARDGQIRRFCEKDRASSGAGWVSAGVYLMGRNVIGKIPEQRPISLEREIFPSYIGHGLRGYHGRGLFLDIGTPESYARADKFFSR